MKQTKPLILVDGSSYLYRAFHAMPSLTNSSGDATGAVYGVINMLKKLISEYSPSHMAVIFDAKGKTFRDDLYDQYKANRPPMPDELRSQIEPLHDLIQALGLPLICISGVEADDVIGTLAQQATHQGIDTLISTGDKDMAQLVNEHVTLINTMNNLLMTPDTVIEKFGVSAGQIIDYLALMGDSADNIPGIPKVGPKTAAKWLQEYGDLDSLTANAEKIGGKVGESLRQNLQQLSLARTLTTIKCDVELKHGISSLQRGEPDANKLAELYQKLEFKTWLREILGQGEKSLSEKPAATITTDYSTILSNDELSTWIERLTSCELFSIDTETTSLNYMEAEMVGISFAINDHEAAYLPFCHDYPDAPEQLHREETLEKLRPILEDPNKAKVGQNLKYDRHIFANHGIQLEGISFDTMLESYVLDSATTRHDMDTLALKYLGHKTIHFEEVAGKGKNQLTFNQVALEQASPYAAEDADITLQLHNTLWPKLHQEPSLVKVFNEIEMPLLPVLSRIEENGVLIDDTLLLQQSGELASEIVQLEQQAYEQAGQPFNLASPKQIQDILFEKQGLPVLQKTPKGQPSTAESVLQDLALDYPLPALILRHRSLSKLKSTYTDKLPLQINRSTGRVHTSYHQAVAVTGRLSSSDPNLQNIPVRNPEGRRIRQAFIAPEGYKIVAADYSQIELRIMAHLSQDSGLLRAFSSGDDIHRATAAEVFDLSPENVSSDERRRAKAINFGLIYGMSAFGLAKQLEIERGAAQQYIDLYFERYPGVKQYMDNIREKAHEQGYVETIFGRRLYLPEINAKNHQRKQYAERTAINAPMQGSAADLIKKAMISIDQWLQSSTLQSKMVMQVHDELVFEVDEAEIDTVCEQVRQLMCNAATLSVPLVVDIGIGDNWEEAH